MKNQKTLILNGDWDYLFILDACRFDFFEEIYKDHLKGKLQRVKSSGSMTNEWALKTFKDTILDDVVYISGHPAFNSKTKVGGIEARKYFHKVIDVWDWGWDENLETTPPEVMLEGLNEAEKKYPKKKKILHFMQPHAPYLDVSTNSKRGTFYPLFNRTLSIFEKLSNRLLTKSFTKSQTSNNPHSGKKALKKKFGNKMLNIIGKRGTSNLRRLLGLPPGPIWDFLMREGKSGLRSHYQKNLELVLESISKATLPSGKKVISADHGEFLAEESSILNQNHQKIFESKRENEKQKDIAEKLIIDGEVVFYGHPRGVDHPILREIPWLEVE